MNPIVDSAVEYSLSVFGLSLLLGLACGAVFSVLRVLRACIAFNPRAVFVQDVFTWAICGFAVFMLALAVSDGVLRGYIVIGTFIGGIVFNMTVGDIMVKWAAAIAAAFKRVSERIKSVFKPLVDRAKAVKMRRVEAKRVKKAAKTVEKRSVKEKSA